MRQFSATDLANKTGDVLAIAARQPVAIARHGKRRFVVLSTEEFETLRLGKDSRSAHHVDDLDDDEAARLVAELEASISND
ncbi:type II toxin-antitoxin system prevent-host-death family antitoxin [uncultured Ruegeria sp.]|uniref:type II toxin-antitoxin system prevent-host-death family antitoxin n=1 Tax=uncultured Ruegeria sp. TaxID=259304 RepID=UPI00019004A7|nr:type II toxin-antitoxin system prevent-host-death family antitoxin [uncultured Ruegeria sp.]EEE35223.1 putative prevent-host-death family protein [Rhodobacteraceae bacterium KLH11]